MFTTALAVLGDGDEDEDEEDEEDDVVEEDDEGRCVMALIALHPLSLFGDSRSGGRPSSIN